MPKKIVGILLLLLSIASKPTTAQLISYRHDGKRVKYNQEQTLITIHPQIRDAKFRDGATRLSLPSVLPGIIGAGFTVTKTLLAQQQEKYTATYNGSQTGIGLIFLADSSNTQSAAIGIKNVSIARIMDRDDTAMEITLVPAAEPHTGLFRFQVESLRFPYAKAKIKKWGNHGKTIDLNLDIKLEAYWKEPAPGTPSSKKNTGADTIGFVLKSGILGQSSILLSGITPKNNDAVYLDRPYYSGWFQTLPGAALQFANIESDWKTGWYTLTITVKEANPYGITSKQRSDFFSAASGDLSTLLKSFIPSK